MPERLSDLGYLALSKETTKGTPATTPSIFVPLYGDKMAVNQNSAATNPVLGQKYAKYQLIPGMRSYGGTVEVMCEPNTAAFFLDMLLNKTGTTGSNPYTHAFSLNATNPNSYTVDIAKGNVVYRYTGVEASEIKPSFTNNEMRLQLKLSALRSFAERGLATVATTTVTLDTKFTPRPTDGLLVGDLVQITQASGATVLNTTVSTVNGDGVTLVLAASAAAFAAGDRLTLRPATPSLNVLSPFLFSSTQFCFGATASAALSAAHTPLEEGSDWTLMHRLSDDKGQHRSGSQEPAALARTEGDATLKIKKFFDLPADQEAFQNLAGQAIVVRHYSGTSNQYELRLTFNDVRIMSGVDPEIKPGEILYSDMVVEPFYKGADGQAFDAKVINAVSTV